MLRFIVLGQIPGTQFQLTFVQLAAGLGVFYAALYAQHRQLAHKLLLLTQIRRQQRFQNTI